MFRFGFYHGQVFEDLDPVSWSHVGHVVEVGGVRDQLVPHLGISQHLSGSTNTHTHENRPALLWLVNCPDMSRLLAHHVQCVGMLL